jgi:hypothetical protein
MHYTKTNQLTFQPYIKINREKGAEKMIFWTAVTIIVVVAIGTEFIVRLVKIGTKYSENMERIKHGYPTLDGSTPLKEPEQRESYNQPERLQ